MKENNNLKKLYVQNRFGKTKLAKPISQLFQILIAHVMYASSNVHSVQYFYIVVQHKPSHVLSLQDIRFHLYFQLKKKSDIESLS